MFGRVIFAVILGVAVALLSSFSLLDRLSSPAAGVAASAPTAKAPTGFAAEGGPSEPPQRESSGYREALLEADQRGQYAGEALINGLPALVSRPRLARSICSGKAFSSAWSASSSATGR